MLELFPSPEGKLFAEKYLPTSLGLLPQATREALSPCKMPAAGNMFYGHEHYPHLATELWTRRYPGELQGKFSPSYTENTIATNSFFSS